MCEKCPDDEWKNDWIELRFTGGRHKQHPYRGRYLSYETNKIYCVPPEYEELPYWEAVDKSEIEEAVEVEVESEVVEEETEPDIQLPSPGLTKVFGGSLPTFEDGITSMDVKTLRMYITGQRGKVDKRWGRKRLIEEALKLQ